MLKSQNSTTQQRNSGSWGQKGRPQICRRSANIILLCIDRYKDSDVHGANMGPTWVLAAPDWPHVGPMNLATVYPKKYARGFCFAVLCCGYTLTDFPISIRLTSLALWQSNDCPSASKATLMNMDKYFMWIHYERLHNHNKAKHNKTVCIFLGIYCIRVLINLTDILQSLALGQSYHGPSPNETSEYGQTICPLSNPFIC